MAETRPADLAARERAVDPHRSVIAQAPAGSGKTTLLATRYLRLLEVVERPEEILAITFTRKAAGEMRARIRAALSAGEGPAERVLERSARLGWGLPEQSSRLAIHTIDAFSGALVRAMPVATGRAPSMRLEERPLDAYRSAVARVLRRLTEADDPLADDIAALFEDFDNRFEHVTALVVDMLGRRDQWLDPLLVGFAGGSALDDVLRSSLKALRDEVAAEITDQLTAAEQAELGALAAAACAELGRDWHGPELPGTAAGWRQLAALFATRDGALRRRLTRAQGFPANAPQHKARAMALLEGLRERGLERLLEAAGRLPDAENLSSTGLRHLATVLSLATVELGQVFDERGMMDFTELTLAARRALGSEDAPSDLALVLDYRIRHLLIDEFQDTSVAQFRLFRQLVAGWQPGDGRTFFAVGDPMQSIYRFRNADVALYMDVVRHGIGDLHPEYVQLTHNFRAQAALVDWTNRVFAPAFGTADDPVLGRIGYAPATATRAGEIDARVSLDVFANRTAEAQGVAASIAALQRGTSEPTMAVLVRSRAHLAELLPALAEAGVTWHGTDIAPLADDPAVGDLMSLIQALMDPFDHTSWLAVLRSPLIGLRLADLLALVETPPSLGRSVLDGDAGATAALSVDGRERLCRTTPLLVAARDGYGRAPTRRWLENAWLRLGGTAAYPAPSLAAAQHFFAVLEQSFPRTIDLAGLTDAVADLHADRAPAGAAAAPPLEIMTIHKAKGLEFDHVFLVGLDRPVTGGDPPLFLWRALNRGVLMDVRGGEMYQWLQYEDRQRDRHEQLRLLYVACTRARESLNLSCVRPVEESTLPAPPRGSLLQPLWDHITDHATIHRTPVPPKVATAPRSDRCLTRLRSGYEWSPPVDWPDLDYHDDLTPRATAAPTRPVRRLEIAVGTVVHETLHALAEAGLPEDPERYTATAAPRWAERLSELGVDDTDLASAVATVRDQIVTTLVDVDGRWTLGTHEDAASEAPFTGLVDGAVTNIVIDRTFRDERGVRWIIDFKSSQPHPNQDPEDFVAGQLADHAAQLRRYHRVLTGLDDGPTRAALYFTALGRLVELPDRAAPG